MECGAKHVRLNPHPFPRSHDPLLVSIIEGVLDEHQNDRGDGFGQRNRQLGDFVEFTIPEPYEARRAILYLVRSVDFGIVQDSVNGEPIGKPIDLYEPDPVTVEEVDLGIVEPINGMITMRVEWVGKNPRSRAPGSYFGLD